MDKDDTRQDGRPEGLAVNTEAIDKKSATGARDVIDPETGVLATGGGPMTTGKGMSASTMGVGSNEGEQEYKDGNFSGSTPGSDEYEKGVDGESSAHPE